MKNVNISGVLWKIRLLEGGGLPKKEGLEQFANLWETWQERERWCFWEGEVDTLMRIMKPILAQCCIFIETNHLIYCANQLLVSIWVATLDWNELFWR